MLAQDVDDDNPETQHEAKNDIRGLANVKIEGNVEVKSTLWKAYWEAKVKQALTKAKWQHKHGDGQYVIKSVKYVVSC